MANPVGPVNALTVGYTETTLAGYRVRLRTYNGSTVGPTLYGTPGQTFSVNVINQLPPNPPASLPQGIVRIAQTNGQNPMRMMGPMKPTGTQLSTVPLDPMNNPHLFNTTNLHVHGVQTIPHIFSPLGTSNPMAMMLAISPGTSFQYNFPIPPDQPSGLYWYHPHHHGATDVQVASGMAGLIVMRGPIDQVPEIASARDIQIAIQTLGFNKSATDPTLYDYEPIAYQLPTAGGYSGGTTLTMFTVNGQPVNLLNNTTNTFSPIMPYQITMSPGEVIRLRILNGSNCFNFPLALPGCEMYVIGFDGINWLAPVLVEQNGTTPITAANQYANTSVFTTSATRVELLIRAPQTPGTFMLSSLANSGITFNNYPQIDLVQVTVTGPPRSMNIPATLPVPTREYPLIADSEIVNKRTITFSEGPTSVLLTGFGFFIDNRLYGETAINYTVKIGTSEEWTILNTSEDPHPFHLHENSFEVVALNGAAVQYGLRDTFLVPAAVGAANGSITIRIRFKGDPGKTVFHCHILPHEDTGMMQNLMMV